MSSIHLPTLNAFLNGITTLLLIAGFIFIKKGNMAAHKKCMGAALATSTLFLTSYLFHHYHHGSTKFMGEGLVRTVYFSVLLSHTVLAAVVLPIVLVTVFYALKENFSGHKRVARWTWPIWMYVSVTGIVVYWMLYQMSF